MTERRTPYKTENDITLCATVRIAGDTQMVEGIARQLRTQFLVTSEVDEPRPHGGEWRWLDIVPRPSGTNEGFTFWEELSDPDDWATWPVSHVEER